MATGPTVGAVWLNVLPSMRDFTRQLTKDASKAAVAAATATGKQLGSELVDETSKTVAKTAPKAAKDAGARVADEVGKEAGKQLPKTVGSAGDAAGAALATAAGKAASKALPAAMAASGDAAAKSVVAAVTKSTERTLPAAMSAQAGKAGEQAGAALSRSMALSGRLEVAGEWTRDAVAAARDAGGQAASALGNVFSTAGPAITGALSGAVTTAITAASSEGVKQAGVAWSSAGASIASAGSATTAALTAPVAAFGALTLKTAGDYEASMNRVRAVSGATGVEFDALNTLAQELGATTQYSASQAADAMGFLAMAGFDTNEILEALPATLNLAAAGQLDLATAADIASNILTGYGFAASDLVEVNDVLAKTFTSTNVDMRMLGDSFKYIAPVAKSAGLQFEEMSAAIGMLGGAGIQGEQAGTVLRGAIARLLQPTGAVKDTLDELSVSVSDSAGNMLPLVDILSQLEDAGASTSDMLTIFGLEAGPGMSALLDQGSDALSDLTKELEGAGGTAETIAEIQMEGLNGALMEMRSAFEGLMLAVADSGLLETATSRVEWLASVLQDLTDTNPELLEAATNIGLFVAAVGPLTWIGGRAAKAVGDVTTAVSKTATVAGDAVAGWRGAGVAMETGVPVAHRFTRAIRIQTSALQLQAAAQNRSVAGMILYNTWARVVRVATVTWTGVQWALNAALNANPIGLVVLAIAALVGGVMLAWKHSETFRNVVTGAWEAIKNTVQPVVDWFTATVWPLLVEGYEWVADVAGRAWDKITAGWDRVVGLFTDPPSFSEVVDALQNVGTAVADWFVDRGRDIVAWLKDLPRLIYEGGTGLGEAFLGLLATVLDPENLTQIGQDIAGHITTGLDQFLDWVQGLPAKIGPHLEQFVTSVTDWASGLPEKVREHVTGLVSAFTDWAADLPEKVRGRLNDFVDTVVDRVRGLPDKIRGAIDFDRAAEWVLDMKDKVVEKLGEIVDEAVEWAKELPDKIRGAIDKAADVKDWFVEWGPKIVAGLGIALLTVVLAIPAMIAAVAAAILFVLGIVIWELGKWLHEKFVELMNTVVEAISSKVNEVGEKFGEIRDSVVEKAEDLRDRVVGFFTSLGDRAVSAATRLRDRVVNAATSLRDRAVNAATGLRDRFLGAVTSLRDRALSAVTGLRDRATSLVGDLRDWVAERAGGLRDRVVGAVETLRDKAVKAFEKAKDGIKAAWEQIEGITKAPVEFIVNTVYNDGIVGVWNKVAKLVGMGELSTMRFADGGVLPGYTPGRDVHSFISPTGGGLELSGGEAIMRPEWTRAVGPRFVHGMNALARTGGVSAVRAALGYANGGIYPVQRFNKGGIFGRVNEFASGLKNIFDGGALKAAVKVVLDPLIETMRGEFTQGTWSDAMVGVPKTMVSKLVEWMKETIGPKLGGDGKKVAELAASYVGVSGNPNQFTRAFGMPGQPWCAMFVSEVIREAKAAKLYNNIRSAAVSSFADSSLSSVSSVRDARPGDLAVYRGRGPGNWGHINVYAGDGITYGGNESNSVRMSTGYAYRADKFMRPKRMATGGIWDQDEEFNTPATTPPLTKLLRAASKLPAFGLGGVPPVGKWSLVGEYGPELVRFGSSARVYSTRESEELVSAALVASRVAPAVTDAQWRDRRVADRSRGRPDQTFNVYETRNPRRTARQVIAEQRKADALLPDYL